MRPPRIELAGGVFHVIARGNERALVFRDDRDRERFLEILSEVAIRYGWRVLAYCLMGNHFHLLVMTLEPTLARGMRHNWSLVGSGSVSFVVFVEGLVLRGRRAFRLDKHRVARVAGGPDFDDMEEQAPLVAVVEEIRDPVALT